MMLGSRTCYSHATGCNKGASLIGIVKNGFKPLDAGSFLNGCKSAGVYSNWLDVVFVHVFKNVFGTVHLFSHFETIYRKALISEGALPMYTLKNNSAHNSAVSCIILCTH